MKKTATRENGSLCYTKRTGWVWVWVWVWEWGWGGVGWGWVVVGGGGGLVRYSYQRITRAAVRSFTEKPFYVTKVL